MHVRRGVPVSLSSACAVQKRLNGPRSCLGTGVESGASWRPKKHYIKMAKMCRVVNIAIIKYCNTIGNTL